MTHEEEKPEAEVEEAVVTEPAVVQMKKWAVAVSVETTWEGRHWWSSTVVKHWTHLFFLKAPDIQVAEAMGITRAAKSHWKDNIELEVNVRNSFAREIPTTIPETQYVD